MDHSVRILTQVRRKRVARDYQLVAKFYRENPIVQIGGNNKISPTKISNQVKAAMKGEGPRQELMDSLRPLTQFYTAQEFGQGCMLLSVIITHQSHFKFRNRI